MTSIGEQELRVRCLSHFVGHRYKKAYFDCITNSHLVQNNQVIQDSKSRVKITYQLKNTEEEAAFFSKINSFDKEVIFTVNVDSREEKHHSEGFNLYQYTAISAKCEQ